LSPSDSVRAKIEGVNATLSEQLSRHPRLEHLINVLEDRLTQPGRNPGSASFLSDLIPDGKTYVLVLFDGLGAHQLAHRNAPDLRRSNVGTIAAPFPTTTTVSLATIATGLPPNRHGVIGHLLWMEDLGRVVNTLKWVTPRGDHVDYDTGRLLPSPNLWERLEDAGVECFTVQPAPFAETPLTRALYRGCRFEGAHSEDDLIEITTTLARQPRRLVFTYLAHVDFAAHVFGQESQEYAESVATVNQVWATLRHRLSAGVIMIGTADHGHIDYSADDKLLIRSPEYEDLTFYGDARALMVRGPVPTARRLAGETGATLVTGPELDELLGEATEQSRDRRPDALLLAPPGKLLLPRGFDKRLTGYHGGLDRREVEIPLLVS
jgi:hypothetical protein